MSDNNPSKKEDQTTNEEFEKQLLLIHRLANRLPWIVAGISVFAFVIILLQVFFFNR